MPRSMLIAPRPCGGRQRRGCGSRSRHSQEDRPDRLSHQDPQTHGDGAPDVLRPQGYRRISLLVLSDRVVVQACGALYEVRQHRPHQRVPRHARIHEVHLQRPYHHAGHRLSAIVQACVSQEAHRGGEGPPHLIRSFPIVRLVFFGVYCLFVFRIRLGFVFSHSRAPECH